MVDLETHHADLNVLAMLMLQPNLVRIVPKEIATWLQNLTN